MANAESANEAKAIIKEQTKEAERKQKASEAPEVKTEEKKAAPVKAEKPKKAEEKVEEKIITISVKDAWKAPRCDRAMTVAKVLKKLLKKNLKRDDVKLDMSLNELIWAKGMRSPPNKIKVKVKLTKSSAIAFPAE